MEKVTKFLLDFLTINVRYFDFLKVLEIFLDSVQNPEVCADNFVYFERGAMSGCNRSLRFLGENYITVNWAEGHNRSGVTLNISGQGCSFLALDDIVRFVKTLDKLEEEYFAECQEQNKKPAFKKLYNVTRADVALDDFDRIIPIGDMVRDIRLFGSNGNNINTSIHPESVQILCVYFMGRESWNVRFGSRESAGHFRLYDKRAEQKNKDVDYWYRLELELRDEKASVFIHALKDGKSFQELFVYFLNKIIRPIELKYISNRSLCPTMPYWSTFLTSLVCIKDNFKMYILRKSLGRRKIYGEIT